jgi:hypothetical protein
MKTPYSIAISLFLQDVVVRCLNKPLWIIAAPSGDQTDNKTKK